MRASSVRVRGVQGLALAIVGFLFIKVGIAAPSAPQTAAPPDYAKMTSAGIALGEAIRVSEALTATYLDSPEFNQDAAELEQITEKLDREVYLKTIALHPELKESAAKLYTNRLNALRRSFDDRLKRQEKTARLAGHHTSNAP